MSNTNTAPSYSIHDALDVLLKIAQRQFAVEKRLRQLRNENAKLKNDVAEHENKIFYLENRMSTKTCYRGVWKPDNSYHVSDEVTHGGRTWHCNIVTSDKPGTSSAWRMKDKEDDHRR